MVGGSIADMYHASDRGLPMNVFTLMNFGGQVSHPSLVSAEMNNTDGRL